MMIGERAHASSVGITSLPVLAEANRFIHKHFWLTVNFPAIAPGTPRWSSVSAGDGNIASGDTSAVSGGGTRLFTVEGRNIASGIASSVSGGLNRTAARDFDWVAGSLVEDE
jgi:hypothetical protein